ncbi:uncharacterized protein LOC105696918 [Orussus abietinus]|uniref:uncharacterized protein LOC105696918 n=1 Tax=Orussus abietinus TaxID=222816 RepID=UPI0006257FB7|nr:uncharacterized protein LOC105696918 [Orussus abietinus]XP_012275180.1 uncharacterized protein LOC105696918 [Orussus abietinus]
MKTTEDVVAVPPDDLATSGRAGDQEVPDVDADGLVGGGKEFGQRTLRSLKRGLGKLWRRRRGNASITEYDPSYKVAYLGNVPTGWAKGEGCVEKPVTTLWRSYVSSSRPDVSMRLTVTNGGLTATTKDHGLTEYWAHRVTYCTAPASHPRLFVWVYRYEGRRLRPELRCHAALCSKESTARRLASTLNARLQQALLEFRRDKVSRQNARLSLANAVYENPSLPRRKILLSTGGQNYRPPLERSKSAPKLSAIEEDTVAEEIEQKRLLDELRSLENVARSWQDQDGWRLARLIEALNRVALGESSDENGSISSGCDTASTANSEERTPGVEETTGQESAEPRSPRRVFFRDQVLGPEGPGGIGPRRNSEGSPNFMTCAGSPKFLACSANRKQFSSREVGGEEEDPLSRLFEFEDVEDFDEVVDYRPHGESPLHRGESLQSLRNDQFPGDKADHFMEGDDFFTLDSLDEEAADSDESGYVEAPPKSLLGGKKEQGLQEIAGEEEPRVEGTLPSDLVDLGDGSRNCDGDRFGKEEDDRQSLQNLQKLQNRQSNQRDEVNEDRRMDSGQNNQNLQDPQNYQNHQNLKDSALQAEENQRYRDKERADFIKCPISETIKKLANASMRSSKSLEISTNNCLKALNNLKTSKSFDTAKSLDNNEESPSLIQRKQLLAQHGVTV